MFYWFNVGHINGNCLICDAHAIKGKSAAQDSYEYICGRCGAYRVSEDFIWEMPEPSNPLYRYRYRIGWAFRNACERVEDIRALPVHPKSEVLPLLRASDPTVEEKLGALLAFLARKSDGPGKYVSFDCEWDHIVVCSKDQDEIYFLLKSLSDHGLIDMSETMSTDPNCRLTVSGWTELSGRERRGAESNNAFIAMSFAADRATIATAIRGAINDTNHTPIQMNQVEHSNRIDDEILSQLRSSKFLVVDLTTQNPGAYFEAGFMLGLGRPVIWVCSRTDLENVHFDTRQYNIIDYDDDKDLQKRLRLRIEAVIGKGIAVSAN